MQVYVLFDICSLLPAYLSGLFLVAEERSKDVCVSLLAQVLTVPGSIQQTESAFHSMNVSLEDLDQVRAALVWC